MEIFVDLDGVLVDLTRGCIETLGHDWISWRPDMTQKEVRMRENLEREVKSIEFWATLPKKQDFDELWNYLKPYEPHILTAHAHKVIQEVHLGKHKWNEKHLDVPVDKFHVVERHLKQKFAKDDIVPNILIDDYQLNIDEWTAAGGVGILHLDSKTTIQQLKELGL